MKHLSVACAGALLALSVQAAAEPLVFLYEKGEQYRIISTVRQDVYYNGRYSHSADILNRITARVTDVRGGSGFIEAVFQTSEEARSAGGVFSWGQTYESRFWRDAQGRYDIHERYYMPVVRNVPVFPGHALRVGETWTARGEEVHDFRKGFGLPEAFRFPVNAMYTYLGRAQFEGEEYDLIDISYQVFHRSDERRFPGRNNPIRLSGRSNQRLYWDNRLGRPHAFSGDFEFMITLASGDFIEFRGTTSGRLIEATRMDRALVQNEIETAIGELGIRDTAVKQDELGVTLTLENIRFPPDSAELIASEREKLDRIAEILKRYPERDILVTGHTALAGTAEGRQRLSEQRAEAVGSYLISQGVRSRERLIFRGLGASQPVADNSSEEGMRRNRRVEITLMEN